MNIRLGNVVRLVFLVSSCLCSLTRSEDILVKVDDAPDHGLVIADVDLTDAVQWCKVGRVEPQNVRTVQIPDGAHVPVQFVPAADYDPAARVTGTLILRLSAGGDASLRISFDKVEPSDGQVPTSKPFDGAVATNSFRVVHAATKMGGLPSRVEFPSSGKIFDRFRWNDRVHDPETGSFNLSNDPQPVIQRASTGPLATVVRVRSRYMQSGGKHPDSRPEATYDWIYLNDSPLVRVTATASQQPDKPWSEAHLLELNFPGDDFPEWAGGEPVERGKFTKETRGFHFNQWGALVDGSHAIAMLDCGRALFYDHRGGSYLHAHGTRSWQAWPEPTRQWSAWLWIGTADNVVEAIRSAAAELPSKASVKVAVASVDEKIAAAKKRWLQQPSAARQQTWWHAAGAAQLADAGRFQQAIEATEGKTPADWTVLNAGNLGMILERGNGGIRLLSLFDAAADCQLSSPGSEPLFELILRDVETKDEVRLTADSGWREVGARPVETDRGVELRWKAPIDERFGGLQAVAHAVPDTATSSISWKLSVAGVSDKWSLWRVVFPQVAVKELGSESTLFLPRAAGQLEKDAWRRALNSSGRYPSGWTTMQYMAAYAGNGSTGLYTGIHDPFGSTKEIRAQSRPSRREVVLSFDHPVSQMGRPGNRFELCGQAVWQHMAGDWFDAAVIYRQWVRQHAKWYPPLTEDGRADTPVWMRELSVWGLGGGDPKSGLPVLQEFAEKMGLPVGFHWYNWHQIPFDNDYPHYFPADEGFADAVKLLQSKDIYIMPYINGRLWDTRDKGSDDFQFSKLARPAATKDEHGEPYTEVYGSKETDGSKVELAAMCPSTELWQTKVREIVLRLMNECGVRGVYIDQIAAAQPRLCFDASHGHLIGGGHWWTEAYWKMMDAIRREMPDGRMLTTECNAEPYVKWFDGYLTWHWQYDGQVPAFPAVYGGSIQMFGRAYRGGPTKNLALRMKAGQQLVFGEQIGWIGPEVVNEKENFAFLRQIVHLRWRLRRYFNAGQMARPPRLHGEIPDVTADWQWHGEWPVTTPVAMSGAWQLPDENRTVLLMVNVGDEPIATRLELDAAEYGVSGDQVRVVVIKSDGEDDSFAVPRSFRRDVTLPPRAAVAWELTPSE